MEEAKRTRRPLLIAVVVIVVVGVIAFAVTQMVQTMPAQVEDGTDTNVADPRPGAPDAGNPPETAGGGQ